MELLVVFVFIVWYIYSLFLSEKYGNASKPGAEWLFFISMVLSPLTAIIFIFIQQKLRNNNIQ